MAIIIPLPRRYRSLPCITLHICPLLICTTADIPGPFTLITHHTRRSSLSQLLLLRLFKHIWDIHPAQLLVQIIHNYTLVTWLANTCSNASSSSHRLHAREPNGDSATAGCAIEGGARCTRPILRLQKFLVLFVFLELVVQEVLRYDVLLVGACGWIEIGTDVAALDGWLGGEVLMVDVFDQWDGVLAERAILDWLVLVVKMSGACSCRNLLRRV